MAVTIKTTYLPAHLHNIGLKPQNLSPFRSMHGSLVRGLPIGAVLEEGFLALQLIVRIGQQMLFLPGR